jgi:hypothetical protein
MQIFVGQTAYQVEASTSIDTLKAMIENKEFIPAQFIRLVNGANTIEGGTLAGNGIEEDDSIAMVYDALAGMRAKWRKSKFILFPLSRRYVLFSEISYFAIRINKLFQRECAVSDASVVRCVNAPVKQFEEETVGVC